jgi:hypothetical protein
MLQQIGVSVMLSRSGTFQATRLMLFQSRATLSGIVGQSPFPIHELDPASLSKNEQLEK